MARRAYGRTAARQGAGGEKQIEGIRMSCPPVPGKISRSEMQRGFENGATIYPRRGLVKQMRQYSVGYCDNSVSACIPSIFVQELRTREHSIEALAA